MTICRISSWRKKAAHLNPTVSKNNSLGQFVNRKQESHNKTLKLIINNNIEIAQKMNHSILMSLLLKSVLTWPQFIQFPDIIKFSITMKIIFFQEHPPFHNCNLVIVPNQLYVFVIWQGNLYHIIKIQNIRNY